MPQLIELKHNDLLDAPRWLFGVCAPDRILCNIPTDEGLFCPAGDFYIDPWPPVATAVITHVHADHARAGSEHYLAQHDDSLPIMRHRLGEHRFTGLDYGKQRRFGAITLSLHPACAPFEVSPRLIGVR